MKREVDIWLGVDIQAAITAALVAEHYRRAAAKIEASPEEHCAAMARSVMKVLRVPQDEGSVSEE